MPTGCPTGQQDVKLYKQTYAHGSHWFMFNLYATISWIVLFAATTMLFAWPITVAYLDAKCSEYKAIHMSIDHARARIKENPHRNEQELRGIQVIIAEWNGWRAFWNKLDEHPIMDYYIPERIHELTPME